LASARGLAAGTDNRISLICDALLGKDQGLVRCNYGEANNSVIMI